MAYGYGPLQAFQIKYHLQIHLSMASDMNIARIKILLIDKNPVTIIRVARLLSNHQLFINH